MAIMTVYLIALIEFLIRRQLISNGMDIAKGPAIAVICAALFFAGMGVYQLYRYKSWVYLVLGLLMGFASLHALASLHVGPFNKYTYLISVIVLVFFVIFNWSFLYGQERFEINSRRLFKLACDSIGETSAGFTARPYHAGTTEYPVEKIEGLARYLSGKFIVKPLYREQGVYLMFSLGASLMNNVEPQQVSYVLFERSGQISVHISAYDYKQYTARFTFNQLCDSFGVIFKRFLEYYIEGHEDRIVVELKSA